MSASLKSSNDRKTIFQAMLLSWVILIISILSPLISPVYTYVTPSYILFFVASLSIFYLSMFFIGLRVSRWVKIPITAKRITTIFTLIIAIAFISRLLDRAIIRPPSDYFSVLSYRQARESGSNIFSILSTFLFPFSLILYGKVKTLNSLSRKQNTLFFVIFTLIFIDILMSGSRGILLVSICALFFERINKKNIIPYASLFALASGVFFSMRFSALMGTDDVRSSLITLSLSGYSYFVPASTLFLGYIESSGLKLAFFSIVQAFQYFAHGFFEFAYIYKTHPYLQFDLSALIPQLSKVQGSSYYLERTGAYYTLPGSLYLGFGLLSLVASAACGIFIGSLYKRSELISRNATGVIILSIFLTPFVNGIGGFDMILFLMSIYIVSTLKVVPSP